MHEEICEKKRRLRALLAEAELDAIYIKRQANFAWLTGGGSNAVGITTELGGVGLLLTAERDYAVCSNIEAPRMEKEERLGEQGYEIRSYPWYEEREAAVVMSLAGGARVGADHAGEGWVDISRRIDPLRYSLTQWEVERYREIGRLASAAAEETMMTVRRGDTECAIVGRLARRLWEDRLDYVTVFCAADDRIVLYRHPIPTQARVHRRVMLSVNARRGGLIVSLTRFGQLGAVPPDLRKRYDASVLIDCTFMAHTVPGTPVAEVFRRGVEAYAQAGYPEEYRLHHQGGAIGYVGRDYRVNASLRETVRDNQAFTWNPSIAGAKSEDTMLARAEGPLLLTHPVKYPALRMEVAGRTFERPDILEL